MIFIAGEGSMGHLIDAYCTQEGEAHAFWRDLPNTPISDSVVIHVGSKKKLLDVVRWCEQTEVPLIHAASGLNRCLPHPSTFAVVIAPSLSLRVNKFLDDLGDKRHLAQTKGAVTSIKVSHQVGKKTPPGTAHAIAELLGVPLSVVEQIGDEDQEKIAFGVEPQYLKRHSHHRVQIFHGAECKLDMTIRVNGLAEYAHGAVVIARAVMKLHREKRLCPGEYSVSYILREAAKRTVPA